MRSRSFSSCIALSLAWLTASPAAAQVDPAPVDPTLPPPDDVAGDIVVTAQKRESTLQNVPFSMKSATE